MAGLLLLYEQGYTSGSRTHFSLFPVLKTAGQLGLPVYEQNYTLEGWTHTTVFSYAKQAAAAR